MKKFFSFLLSMLFLLPAAGCKSKNSFSVTFENQCDAEIQSAFVEYYVGDTDEIGKILVASSSAAAGTTGSFLRMPTCELSALNYILCLPTALRCGQAVSASPSPTAGPMGMFCAAMWRRVSSFSAEIAENRL